MSQHVARFRVRETRFMHFTAPPPHDPQPFFRIDRVPAAGQDPHPALQGFAALRNTSPKSSPRKILCPRAENLPPCAYPEARNDVNGIRQAKPGAGLGRAAWAEGEHIPHPLHRFLPVLSLPRKPQGGRQLRSGCSAYRGGRCHLAGSGMDNQPIQSAASTFCQGPPFLGNPSCSLFEAC